MKIDLNIDKVIAEITKVKIPYLTNFIVFISSFNFWFLTIYFLQPEFISNNGMYISLMTTFSLTITWVLFAFITFPKDIVLNCLLMGIVGSAENILNDNKTVTLFIFAETIIFHSFFLYLGCAFEWSLFLLISVSFFSAGIKYLVTDFLVRKLYKEYIDELKKTTHPEDLA
jgi:hypothetical protein